VKQSRWKSDNRQCPITDGDILHNLRRRDLGGRAAGAVSVWKGGQVVGDFIHLSRHRGSGRWVLFRRQIDRKARHWSL